MGARAERRARGAVVSRRIEKVLLKFLLWLFAATEERHVCRCELCAETREQFERKRRKQA